MAQSTKYYPTGAISRFLVPGERSYVDVVYQQGKLVTDAELNLAQDIRDDLRKRVSASSSPSGFIRNSTRRDSGNDFVFEDPYDDSFVLNPEFQKNTYKMGKQSAILAGFPLTIEYSNTDTVDGNVIQLDDPPILGGTPPDVKRTDFVFLEAWFALIEPSLKATGSLTVANPLTVVATDTVTVDGTVLTAVVGAPAANEFEIGVDSATTAVNLGVSITANITTVQAITTVGIPTVTLVSVAAGTPGNSIAISSSSPASIVLSGPTLSGGVDKPNKPDQDSIYRHGNVDSSLNVALPDDLVDPAQPPANSVTTLRVQLQYRIRVHNNVNFKVQCDGFSSSTLQARGTQAIQVAGYEFVPADRVTVRNNSSAVEYDLLDSGLYIAGDGSENASNDLGTVDGYVYALPMSFVFRKNDAYIAGAGVGWDPLSNTNGALTFDHGLFINPDVYAQVDIGRSDRPDGEFADAIAETDVLDLRRHVSTWGLDLGSELQYQMQSLLDGDFKTWAIDAADKNILGGGSGDVSTQFLVCNQIGRTASSGGNPPLSGDTTRGDTIRNFDHIARRFGSQSVVEKHVLPLLPNDLLGSDPGKYVNRPAFAVGFSGWVEGDEIHLDFSNLNPSTLGDFDPAGESNPALNTSTLWPTGTVVSDVVSIYHDDGNYNMAVDQVVQMQTVIGLGNDHVVITLDFNDTMVTGGVANPEHKVVGNSTDGDVGSSRRIFVEVEISYPIGEGLTDTPDLLLEPDSDPFPFGTLVENDITLAQRPSDMEVPLTPLFRSGFRETKIEYKANDPDGGVGHPGAPIGSVGAETVVSRDVNTIVLPRRIFGTSTNQVVITDQVSTANKAVDQTETEYGSSSRVLKVDIADQLSGVGQTLTAVTYFAQDPVPNSGGAGLGYQIGVYYRSNAPQTAGVKEGAIGDPGTAFPYIGIPGPLPNVIVVEPLLMDPRLWTGQVGMGSAELPFPYYAPLDQIPVNDGRTSGTPVVDQFPGEWYFSAQSEISVSDFSAQTGLLNLHSMVQVDGTQQFTFGNLDVDKVPFKDAEFRACYPFSDDSTYRPTAMAQSMSGAVRHKVFTPFLAKSTQDSVLWRKGELLLLVLSRWAELDDDNVIRFIDNDNRTCVGIYRTKNLMLLVE